MYRIQSSSIRHLMNLLRGVKMKNKLVTTREASSEISAPQYFKPKIKKVCHCIQYFLCVWTFAFVPKSYAAKFTVRIELGWSLVLQGTSFEKSLKML